MDLSYLEGFKVKKQKQKKKLISILYVNILIFFYNLIKLFHFMKKGEKKNVLDISIQDSNALTFFFIYIFILFLLLKNKAMEYIW